MSLLDFLAGPNENIPADEVEPLSYPIEETGQMITQPEADSAYQSPDEETSLTGVAMPEKGSLADPNVVFTAAANQFGVGQVPISTVPVKIISANPNCQAVLLTNTSNALVIFIGPSAGSVATGGGYILNPNSSVTLPINADIYVASTGANVVTYITMQTSGLR